LRWTDEIISDRDARPDASNAEREKTDVPHKGSPKAFVIY
jgi:hypothetical protein